MSEARLYRAFCKATQNEGAEPRYSHNWVTARRAWFCIYSDRVECGDWIIPFDQIEASVAYRARQMFIPVLVLKIVTPDCSYQFGFNPWANPVDHLPIETHEEKIRLKYSVFSLALRIFLVAYLLYLWFQ